MRWKRQARWLFGVGLALLLASVSVLIWLYLMDARANVSPHPQGSLLDMFVSAQGDSETQDDGFVEVDWEYWRAINPDLIAWVNVEGTSIDYPIMRAPKDDPTFYLHHDIYRDYSVYGVPYLDTERSESGQAIFNAIIYGHHMDNGSMFSDFASYSDEDYAREHETICLQTPLGKQRLRVSHVCIVNGDTTSKATRFVDVEAFQEWFEEQQASANVVLDAHAALEASVTQDERALEDEATDETPRNEHELPTYAITFCTCSYHQFDNERTLVVCVPETDTHP